MYWLVAALVIAGWMAVLIGSRRTLRSACAELRLEFQRQIDSLSAKIEALERTANAPAAAAPISASAGSRKMESPAGSAVSPIAAQAQSAEEISPETLATIAKTVAVLLGRKVHVRSVKMLPTPDAILNPWAEHGRAVVQASHNFSQRTRES